MSESLKRRSLKYRSLKRRLTNLTAMFDVQPITSYQLRGHSSLVKTSYDNMISHDSTDNEEDDEYADDELLLNEMLLQFLKYKDKHNITDKAIRILNILESEYGICPTLLQLKKLSAMLNKNISIRKCDHGEFN
ncbi:unnamed protein product [Didymodactylos carnosus]|uniref:Uncharacterized protein n=1 Tax=Didymodactylos carnosus TaxID=1234261 RepID=A0A8S2FG57_9BILA|nr:unnamed protein product [Didymodactylos carnosus]CAF4251577.1 unnamed protein product [Didymodactylos carnosus]